jgi:hypothetical protein
MNEIARQLVVLHVMSGRPTRNCRVPACARRQSRGRGVCPSAVTLEQPKRMSSASDLRVRKARSPSLVTVHPQRLSWVRVTQLLSIRSPLSVTCPLSSRRELSAGSRATARTPSSVTRKHPQKVICVSFVRSASTRIPASGKPAKCWRSRTARRVRVLSAAPKSVTSTQGPITREMSVQWMRLLSPPAPRSSLCSRMSQARRAAACEVQAAQLAQPHHISLLKVLVSSFIVAVVRDTERAELG